MPTSSCRLSRLASFCLAACLLGVTSESRGQATVDWTPQAINEPVYHFSNFWESSANWSTGMQPGVSDIVYLGFWSGGHGVPAELAVDLGGARTIWGLYVAYNGIQGGSLALAQTDQFGLSLVVSKDDGPGYFNLLPDTILTSTAIAQIGKSVAGSETGRHQMLLLENTTWMHSGLIEVGANGSRGELFLHTNSRLNGGLSNPPIININRAGAGVEGESVLIMKSFATLDATDINLHGALVVMPNATLFTQQLTIDHGGRLLSEANFHSGNWTPGLGTINVSQALRVGVEGNGYYGWDLDGSDGPINFTQYLYAGTVEAGVAAGSRGSIQLYGGTVIGQVGGPSGDKIVTLGRDPGSTGSLSLVAGYEVGNMIVHGAVEIGRYGAGHIQVAAGRRLDVNGDAYLGGSDSTNAGYGSLLVNGPGAVFSAQKMVVGYSYFDSYSYNPYPSPAGRIEVGNNGRVEVTGYIIGDGWGDTPDAEGNYAFGPTFVVGSLSVGKNGILNPYETGKIAFVDPTNGTGVRHYGTQKIINYGTITGGSNSTPAGSHIDFGALGGTLVNAGTISPGYDPVNPNSWLTINGDLTFYDSMGMGSPGRLLINFFPLGSLRFDVLEVRGDVDLTGATVEFSLFPGTTLEPGATFHFLQVTGLLTGMFGTVIDHTGLGLTLDDVSIVDGGVMLTMPASAVPEPSTYAVLVGLGALGFAWAARHQRR